MEKEQEDFEIIRQRILADDLDSDARRLMANIVRGHIARFIQIVAAVKQYNPELGEDLRVIGKAMLGVQAPEAVQTQADWMEDCLANYLKGQENAMLWHLDPRHRA